MGSAAEHRRFAAKKAKTKSQAAKAPKIASKCRGPDRHFDGAVKNIEFLTAPFFYAFFFLIIFEVTSLVISIIGMITNAIATAMRYSVMLMCAKPNASRRKGT